MKVHITPFVTERRADSEIPGKPSTVTSSPDCTASESPIGIVWQVEVLGVDRRAVGVGVDLYDRYVAVAVDLHGSRPVGRLRRGVVHPVDQCDEQVVGVADAVVTVVSASPSAVGWATWALVRMRPSAVRIEPEPVNCTVSPSRARRLGQQEHRRCLGAVELAPA